MLTRTAKPACLLLVALLVVVLGGASVAVAASSNSLMAISADGKIMACANRDAGTVTIITLDGHQKHREIAVGKHPEGVAFLGDSYLFAVTNYHDDTVTIADAATGETRATIDVYDEPYGAVSSSDGSKLYVTLSYPGHVIEIDAKTHKVARTFDAGAFPRGIAISDDDKRLYVTEYYTAIVHAIDIGEGKIVDSWEGTSTDNLARQITLHPKRGKAYMPHIRSSVSSAHGEGSIFPYVTVIDTPAGEGRRRKRKPMDAFIGNRVTANPWEVDITPDGKTFFVVFSGTNDMFVADVIDDDYREITYRASIQLGNNPRAVRVSPNGERFYVYNALDFEVVAYDAKSLRQVATVKTCDNPLGEEKLLGKRLFYSALQPMVGRRWISCSSCHPDGESDGRTWQNPEGLRNTPPLAAMAWTHPLHWSADRDETQDFEHTIRGQLMQGRGLVRGRYNDGLGEPNKGLSRELDALAAYSNSHGIPLSPHAKGGLTDAAKRGRAIFHSAATQCATCHSGPFYTDSTPGEKIIRHDVGTGRDDKSELMGTAYDTPTLLGVYRSAPYFHDGSAATLKELLTTANPDDKHGKTSHLSAEQVAELVEFLKALPYEDPVPAAEKAGMKKVER